MMVTDNATVEPALCNGYSKSVKVTNLYRRLFWLSIEFNFVFTSVYIPRKTNVIADALSRLDESSGWDIIFKANVSGIYYVAVIYLDICLIAENAELKIAYKSFQQKFYAPNSISTRMVQVNK